MASVNKVICPTCNSEYLRTVKQVNAVIKRSGKWTCKKCANTAKNKLMGKPIGATRIHNKNGYVLEKTAHGWVRQHMLIMENYLCRKLKKYEAVHHINYIKTDNDIDNLIVMNHGEHSTLHNLERAKHGIGK